MKKTKTLIENKIKRRKWRFSDFELVFMASLSVLFLFVFAYLPMGGMILAFKDGDNSLNILDALFMTKFVGFDNFKAFFHDPEFTDVLLNTLGLNLIRLIVSFPMPILFALLLNELRLRKFKRTVQSISILPHFLSWVVFGGIIIALCDMTTGLINPILYLFGIGSKENPINLLSADYFWPLIIIAGILKGFGWGSVIYLAAITDIDVEIYEAAEIDGAGRFSKMFRITLPMILPTITVFLLLSVSNLLNNSFEQFYMLQNSTNLSRSEVLATYIFKTGLIQRRYAFTSALGLFESVCGLILLLLSNYISKKVSGRGLYNERR